MIETAVPAHDYKIGLFAYHLSVRDRVLTYRSRFGSFTVPLEQVIRVALASYIGIAETFDTEGEWRDTALRVRAGGQSWCLPKGSCSLVLEYYDDAREVKEGLVHFPATDREAVALVQQALDGTRPNRFIGADILPVIRRQLGYGGYEKLPWVIAGCIAIVVGLLVISHFLQG